MASNSHLSARRGEDLEVVELPYALPYEGDEQVPVWTAAAERFRLGRPFEQFEWLRRVLPALPTWEAFRAAAYEGGFPVAWSWEYERGDTPYADAAWIVDPSSGEWLFVQETIYMGRDLSREYRVAPRFEERPWAGSAHQEAMLRLGG